LACYGSNNILDDDSEITQTIMLWTKKQCRVIVRPAASHCCLTQTAVGVCQTGSCETTRNQSLCNYRTGQELYHSSSDILL
jgi:hypothetical protein